MRPCSRELEQAFFHFNKQSLFIDKHILLYFWLVARILGIDYGEKRSGLAVTDPLGIAVNPLTALDTVELFAFIEDYLVKEQVEKIVLGMPSYSDDSPTPIVAKILKFIKKLNTKFPHVDTDTIDEGFSSAQAKQAMILSGVKKQKRRDKYLIDKMSAVIILQEYLGHI
jgi:putative Holliday junction resolvase